MVRGRSTIKIAFLDSSVLFTAVNSPTGGSAKLFTIKGIKLFASRVVLAEVERNVRAKLRSHHVDRFFRLVEKLEITHDLPGEKLVDQARKVIAEKDAVILAEAKRLQADYLVTLDKKHFLTPEVGKFLRSRRIMTPKMVLDKLRV